MYESREEKEVRLAFVEKLQTLDLPGWTTHQKYEHSLYFVHDTGATFFVTLPGSTTVARAKNGKVVAIASYPKNADGQNMSASDWGVCRYNETANRIGFSHSKSAKAITRDLQRRLIPGVLAAHETITAKLREQEESQNTVTRVVASVAEVFVTDDIREQNSYSARVHSKGYRNQAYVRNSDEGVRIDLELGDLTLEQVQAIARVVVMS